MEPITAIFSIIVLLFSVIMHELAHGSVAYSLGDPTAKYEGRLTLNPLKHLDPFGSVILPLMLLVITAGAGPIFGWAKPVPVNPYNLRDQKWGSLKVAIAGPATNFAIAIFFGLIIRFLDMPQTTPFISFLSLIALYNFLWGVFNLVPIPPLDGSWILFRFLPDVRMRTFLQQYGLFLLIFFIFFGGLQGLGNIAGFLYSLVTGTPFMFL